MTNFNLLAPEINVKNIHGAGSKPLLAAQVAWFELSKELSARAEEWMTQVTSVPDLFKGQAAGKFIDAAREYHGWLNAHAETAREHADRLGQAAHIYDQTVEGMVPTSVIAANRGATLALKATNLFGQFSTKIADLYDDYQKMWTRNAEMMNAYQVSIFDVIAKVEESGIRPAPLVISASSTSSFGGFNEEY